MRTIIVLSLLLFSYGAQASNLKVSLRQDGFFGISQSNPAGVTDTFGYLEGSFDAVDNDGDGIINYVAGSESSDTVSNFTLTYVSATGELQRGGYLDDFFLDDVPETRTFELENISRLDFNRSEGSLTFRELSIFVPLEELIITTLDSNRTFGGLSDNVNTNFGSITRSGLKVSVVPLPAPILLFCTALLSLVGYKRLKSA